MSAQIEALKATRPAAPPPASGRRERPTPNPFLDGRREWMERYGSYIQAAHQWRITALGALFIALFAVAGMAYTATQNHFVPYVVQVDRLGTAIPVGRADVASRADHRILRAQLARWVANIRTVYVDAAAQRSAIDEGYAMLTRGTAAFNLLNDYFRANSPFERAERETVTVSVHAVLPMSADTWRIEWEETVRDRNGGELSRSEWQAALTVLIDPPKDEDTILRNPLGIYITDFSWTKRQ